MRFHRDESSDLKSTVRQASEILANSLSLLNFDVLVKNVQGLDDVGTDFENKIRTKAIRQVMPSINFITRYNVADIKS